MRPNDRTLLENVEDYFTHKGVAPNLIDDVKENLRKDIQKSEAEDKDYIEYRQKSPAEIILTIQKNLFIIQFNPVVFFIINFILISSLYDKQLIPFGAATGLSLVYMFVILPISIIIYTRIMHKNYLYRNKLESYAGGALAIIAVILILMNAFDFYLGIHVVTQYMHMVIALIGLMVTAFGLYRKYLEYTGIGLLLLQKTIDVIVPDEQAAQLISIAIWVMILVLIIFYTIELSTRKKS
ncbi:hypothetical protein [Staphylococcus lutrae]|uniref:Uncharacterized protein n=1 Tax=Staphylococcus lutrae TaxID=155085 RepID=A0AAC9WJD7_9STAP|nr:hypothetical protein [Staphylococcus lutrae]ARJ51165.1 hypothetical protein B5P37_07520 [Staphylococcus lutrae]PNZ37909.1 hypothetical protein CD134_05350 [Staphylococcus lutrae]